MADRQSILGFTEAELGFFLVLLCVVLWAAGVRNAPAPKPTPERASITPDSLLRLQMRLAELEDAVDSLQRAVDSLRSPILPSCRSRGLSSGPLLTVVLVAPGLFRVDHDTLDLPGLDQRTARACARARAAQCREEVLFRVRRDLTAAASEQGRQRIYGLGLRISSGTPVVR